MTPLPAGIGFGRPLGGPRVAQASPKGHAGEAQASIGVSAFVCNKRWKKGEGVLEIAEIAKIW